MWYSRLRPAVSVAIALLALGADPALAERVEFSIPAGHAAETLKNFGAQAGVQMLFVSNAVEKYATQAVQGELEPSEALRQMLAGTGLTFEFVNERTVTIRAAAAAPSAANETEESRRNEPLLARIVASSAMQPAQLETEMTPAESSRAQEEPRIDEVIVTAYRREQRASDIAGGIQVFSGHKLDEDGANGFQDYLLQVPGASFRDQGNGATRIALRGIGNLIGSDYGTTTTVSTVGVYLNDVPIQGTSVLPDLALYDLARIEVLTGPQGTLYGEGAMGGAVRMILQPPNLERVEGKSDATLSTTHSGGMNYRLRTMFNAPLSESVAIRLVGTYRDDSGFIDNLNPALAENNYNSATSYSARGSLLANVTERFSLELLALFNSLDMDGPNQVMKSAGDLVINYPDVFDRQYNKADQSILGLTLKYRLPFAELTSVTSRYAMDREFIPRFPLAVSFAPVIRDNSMIANIALDSISQEVRLVSSGDRRFDWVLGAFYRDKETSQFFDERLSRGDFIAANAYLAAAGRPTFATPLVYHELGTETYEQYAFYGEGTFALADRLDLTVGLRWYDENRTYDPAIFTEGPLAPFASDGPLRKVNDDGVVPKAALSYRLAEDRLVYASASQGFRTSVINLQYRPDGLGNGEPSAESDSLWNYELGAKTMWRDGRLMVNGTLYYIDWSKLQLPLTGISPVTGLLAGYVGNGGRAEVHGASLQSAALLTERLSVGLNVGYMRSEMVEGSGAGVTVGERLPNSPEWTASAQAEYRMPFAGRGEGFVRLSLSFVDDQTTRVLTLRETNPQPLESYAMGDLRIGADLDNGWDITFFIENISDERAELGRGVVAAALRSPEVVSVARPRTIGVLVGTEF